jgi:hypothetical protein
MSRPGPVGGTKKGTAMIKFAHLIHTPMSPEEFKQEQAI